MSISCRAFAADPGGAASSYLAISAERGRSSSGASAGGRSGEPQNLSAADESPAAHALGDVVRPLAVAEELEALHKGAALQRAWTDGGAVSVPHPEGDFHACGWCSWEAQLSIELPPANPQELAKVEQVESQPRTQAVASRLQRKSCHVAMRASSMYAAPAPNPAPARSQQGRPLPALEGRRRRAASSQWLKIIWHPARTAEYSRFQFITSPSESSSSLKVTKAPMSFVKALATVTLY